MWIHDHFPLSLTSQDTAFYDIF